MTDGPTMLRQLLFTMAGKLIAIPLRRRLARFHAALYHPETVQAELLRSIVARHAATAFGKDHHFHTIRSLADFRKQVPIATYDYFAPYIERVRRGETSALLDGSKLLMFALTSGTTASRKLIPVTEQYVADYKRGWNLWGLQAMQDHKPIAMRPMLQLAGDPEEFRTEANIPCGNLSGFTAQVQKKLIRRLYAVPGCAARIKDSFARYYVALRFALSRPIGMMLAANPSTLLALARTLDQEKASLLKDLHDGTLRSDLEIAEPIRQQLHRLLRRDRATAQRLTALAEATGRLYPRDVWGSYLLGTWTGGSVGAYLRLLPQYYGDAPVRDLGLLASEGRMTIPYQDHTPSGILDVTTHYFEFVPEAEIDSPQPTVLAAHEVQEGETYYILPTTASGLYRYHIVDLVRVTGFFGRTPLIEFLGKGNRMANITGEKLSEHQVVAAMSATLNQVPQQRISAYTLAPIWDDEQPFYGIFLEESDHRDEAILQRFLQTLDSALQKCNMEYQAKRESGRLGSVRALLMPEGSWRNWDRARLAKTGGSPEQYKRPALIGDLEFHKTMPVTHWIGAELYKLDR